MRLSVSQGLGHTPVSPLLPPVKLSHWKQIDHKIWPKAKVSMAR